MVLYSKQKLILLLLVELPSSNLLDYCIFEIVLLDYVSVHASIISYKKSSGSEMNYTKLIIFIKKIDLFYFKINSFSFILKLTNNNNKRKQILFWKYWLIMMKNNYIQTKMYRII